MPILVIVGIIGVAVVVVLAINKSNRSTTRNRWGQSTSNWNDSPPVDNSNVALTTAMLFDSFDTGVAPSSPDVPVADLAAPYDAQPNLDSQMVAAVEAPGDMQVEAPDTNSGFDSGSSDSGSSSSSD